MKSLLQIDHLTKTYSSFQLKDVSFRVPGGSIMGLIGENGAGKTTTIKLILNETSRDSGSIKIFGLDNQTKEIQAKEQIGVVFDESYFHGDFTAGNIASVLRRFYRLWDDALYRRYLEEFGVPFDKAIKEFSKGMKMKLNIATALAHHPRLLILDEATSGLDPVVRREILDLFLDFIQDEEHSVLFSSHITSDLERVADYITLLHGGKVVLTGCKDDIIYSYGVLKCGAEEFEHIAKDDVLLYRKEIFGVEALVADQETIRRKYPGCLVDNVTLDDIMLFYGKGESL